MKAIPELPRFAAKSVYQKMLDGHPPYHKNGSVVPVYEHEQARKPSGGRQAMNVEELTRLRAVVLEDLSEFSSDIRRISGLTSNTDFDRVLATSLGNHLSLSPQESSNVDMWSFLSLLVFPEFIWARFRTPSEARALGGKRNILRVAWERFEALGSVLNGQARPLGEDELVGLLERTRVARNRGLVQGLARHLLSVEMANRSDYARRLFVETTKLTGPLLLDAFSDAELDNIVAQVATRVRKDADLE